MQKIDQILYRKMTRKEFLGTIGLGIVTLLGFPALMGILNGHEKPTNRVSTTASSALMYGIGSYGGASKHST